MRMKKILRILSDFLMFFESAGGNRKRCGGRGYAQVAYKGEKRDRERTILFASWCLSWEERRGCGREEHLDGTVSPSKEG
jgi:hypothetical protein